MLPRTREGWQREDGDWPEVCPGCKHGLAYPEHLCACLAPAWGFLPGCLALLAPVSSGKRLSVSHCRTRLCCVAKPPMAHRLGWVGAATGLINPEGGAQAGVAF